MSLSDPLFLRQQQQIMSTRVIISRTNRMDAAVAPIMTVILSLGPEKAYYSSW